MKSAFDCLPPELTATAEERERAVAYYEAEVRPLIAADTPRVSRSALLQEAERILAERRLEELRAAKDEPVVVGEGLRAIIERHRVEVERRRKDDEAAA